MTCITDFLDKETQVERHFVVEMMLTVITTSVNLNHIDRLLYLNNKYVKSNNTVQFKEGKQIRSDEGHKSR